MTAQYGRFNVYQLVRLLRWRGKGHAGENPGVPAPVADVIRFRADLSAAFPGREISKLAPRKRKKQPAMGSPAQAADTQGEIIEISTPNYCVASALGPLPAPFTEWIRDQERAGEKVSAEFLNLFNHRLNTLRHQLKAAQDMAVNSLPPDQAPQAAYLGAIAGIALPQMQAQLPIPRRAWLALAGLLANCRKSAATVQQILRLFLGVPVTITSLVGAWRDIEPGDRQLLGVANQRLGQQSLLGHRVWDQQARLRVAVAPLSHRDFLTLLPGQGNPAPGAAMDAAWRPDAASLAGLIRLLLDRRCDCELELAVQADTIPPTPLSQSPTGSGPRLSYTAWLGKADAPAPGGREPRPLRTVRYLIPAFGPGLAP